MDRKEKRNIEINLAFVIIAAILSFFINIFSDAVFDIYKNGPGKATVIIFLVSSFLSVSFVNILSFIVENSEKLKNSSLSGIFKKYILSFFLKK